MTLYRIRITTGELAGRFVGQNIGGGLITNKELQANREVKVPGTKYSLYVQEGGAMQFFEHAAPAVQSELKKLGYETELVAV
jgi:hypothetical protein